MKKIWLNEKFSALAAISLGLVSAACGGGGGDGTNLANAVNPALVTGVFSDAPVDGLIYKTYTINAQGTYLETNASTTKKTSDGGKFQYNAVSDSRVRFFVDNLAIGEAATGSVVTPMDLVADSTTALANVQDPDSTDRVIKVLRLLQTLDSDNNPSNGITLNAGRLKNPGWVDTFDITKLTDADFVTSPPATTVSVANATKHFMTELQKLDASGKPAKQAQFANLVKKLNSGVDPTLTVDGKTGAQMLTDLWPQSRLTALDTAIKAKLKSLTESSDGTKHGTLPGVVIKVRMPNGTDQVYSSGYSDLGASTSQISANDTLMTDTKHFRLGSITKTLTGMTAMDLVSEYGYNTPTKNITTATLGDLLGATTVTTTAPKSVSGYSAATFRAAVDPNNKLSDAQLALFKEVTVYQLLTHLSGLKQTSSQQMEDKLGYYDYNNVWALQGYLDSELATKGSAFTAQELLNISYDLGLEEPGKGWHYSNANYVLLGKVIENLSPVGTKWHDVVKAKFGPTGATQALATLDNYVETLPPTLPGDNTVGATGYIDWYSNFAGACKTVDAKCEKDTKYSVKIHPSFYGAAGGLTGTVHDLYTWAQYLGTKYEDPAHPIGMLKDTYFKVIPNVLQMGPAVFKNLDRKLVGHPGQVQGYDCYVGYRYNTKDPIAACANTTLNDGGKIQALLLNSVMDMIDGKTAL
ncbi:MAG: beta-lactamase family protein [Magnetococcales bacterium]|nr:beta-lactamase family protein [Magnetococcales bacterium]